MKADLNKLMKQAQEMQEKLKHAQEQLVNMTVVGESGGGLVKVTMNGRHEVKNVDIDNGLLTEDKDVIEDTIAAAVNDAVRKVEKETGDKMKSLASGMDLPEGFDMPGGGES